MNFKMHNNELEENMPIKIEIEEEEMDESQWRDVECFAPFGEAEKFEQIRNLFMVNKHCKSTNFIYFNCGHIKEKVKCKYSIRWRKADGMVQSKELHNHKKFVVRVWKKCSECPFESITDSLMHDHYVQNHPNVCSHCPECAAIFENANKLQKHIQQFHPPPNSDIGVGQGNGSLEELQKIFDAIIQKGMAQNGGGNGGQQQMNQTTPNFAMPLTTFSPILGQTVDCLDSTFFATILAECAAKFLNAEPRELGEKKFVAMNKN